MQSKLTQNCDLTIEKAERALRKLVEKGFLQATEDNKFYLRFFT